MDEKKSDSASDCELTGINTGYDNDSDDNDSEMNLFSDNDSSNEIIDDTLVDNDTNHNAIDSHLRLQSEDSAIQTLLESLGNVTEDVEFVELKSDISSLNLADRLLVLYMLSLYVDNLRRMLEVDEVLRAMPCTEYFGFKYVISNLGASDCLCEECYSFVHTRTSNCRKSLLDTYNSLADRCKGYFFEDVDVSFSVSEFSNRVMKMLEMFNLNIDDIQNYISNSKTSVSAFNTVRRQVNIKKNPNKADENHTMTIDDLLAYDSENIEPSQTHEILPKKKHNDVATKCVDIIVWKGDNNESEALSEYQKESHIFKKRKDVMNALYVTNFNNRSDAYQVITNNIPVYHVMVSKIIHFTKCSLNAARKMAYDINTANVVTAIKYLTSQNSCLTPSSQSVESSLKKKIIGNYTAEEVLEMHPQNDESETLIKTSKKDARFTALPPDWTYREGLPCGIFQDFLQMNTSAKHLLLVVFGDDNIQKFQSENCDDFLQFNSDTSRLSKNGLWACEHTNFRINDIPLRRVMYVVLSMGRKSQLQQIIQEIAWFLKLKSICLSECLVELFNNDSCFGQCYRTIDEIRRESEGGFIGQVNEQLRKSLKLNESDQKVDHSFKVIVEYFQENNLVTIPACIRKITEIGSSTGLHAEKDREFGKAVASILGSGVASCNSVKSAVWWNEQLSKYISPFLKDNKNLLSFKIANDLFTRINKMYDGYLLDPNVDITDWDENEMGPMQFKGTVLQNAILNLIQELRTKPTDLMYILKINKIQPAAFFNTICKTTVIAGRRSRCLLFTGPKQSGKSIIANALLKTFDGDRVAIDVKNGRDFNIASTTNENVGLVLLEDASKNSLLYMDTQLRPFIDGDEIVTNQKMKATSKGKWRSVVVTTNEPENSDSDDENKLPGAFSMRKHKVLEKRYSHVQFRTDLAKHKHFVSNLDESDIYYLFYRYGLFPICKGLYHGTRCHLSPCAGPKYGQHHPNCPLVREIHSNLQFDVRMSNTINENGDTIDEFYERVEETNIGLVFDIAECNDMLACFKCFYQINESDLNACRSVEATEKKKKKSLQIHHFMDYIWKPLCYLSQTMKGNYDHIAACDWAHRNALSHIIFAPQDKFNYFLPTMAQLARSEWPDDTDHEDLLSALKLMWCLPQHKRYVKWADVLSTNTCLSQCSALWTQMLQSDVNDVVHLVRSYISRTANKKRFKKHPNRTLKNLAFGDNFDKLFLSISGYLCMSSKVEEEQIDVVDLMSAEFFD